MARFCPECGAKQADSAKFCTECGGALAPVPARPRSEQPQSRPGAREERMAEQVPFQPQVQQPYQQPMTQPQPQPQVQQPMTQGQMQQSQMPPQQAPQSQMQSQQAPQSQMQSQPQMTPQMYVAPSAFPMAQNPPAARGNPNRGKKILCAVLAVVLAVELGVAGFKYPGFLRKKTGGDPTIDTVSDPSEPGTGGAASASSAEQGSMEEILSYFGLSGEDLEALQEEPFEVTADNSPGNPIFIDVTYTDADYSGAKTLSAPVSRENPEADFPEFGVHVNLKSYNLDNAEDTLVVTRLPDKTSEAADCILYTYDFSLASGQSKFYTSVEVTAPILGDPDAFMDVLTFNEETGLWEEVYSERNPDGVTYTAYYSHFSLDTQRNARQALGDAAKAVDFYKTLDGKSIFYQLDREFKPKYKNANHYLYPVTVMPSTDLGAFMNDQYKENTDVLKRVVDDGGGIPAEVAYTSGVKSLGFVAGAAGGTATHIYIEKKLTNTLSKATESKLGAIGITTTLLGDMVLALNVTDQINRNVDEGKIWTDSQKEDVLWNSIGTAGSMLDVFSKVKWGWATAKVAEGTLKGLSVAGAASFASTVISVICAGYFVYTSFNAADAYLTSRAFPCGDPCSIIEATQHYYMQNNAYSENGYVNNPAADRLDRTMTYEHFPEKLLSVDGRGWGEAIELISKKYVSEPQKLGKALLALYENFGNAFWKESKEVKRANFRAACQKYVRITMIDRYDDSTVYVGDAVGYEWDKPYGLTGTDLADWKSIQGMLQDHAERLKTTNPYGTMADVWAAVFKDWDENPQLEDVFLNKMNEVTYHDREQKILKQVTNEIIYDFWMTKYREGVLEVKERLYNEVLPLLNARLTFYARDRSTNSTMGESLAYRSFNDPTAPKYEFTFDGNKNPLCLPQNHETIENFGYHLDLVPNANSTVLLETTVYHYLMFGCPEEVTVKAIKDGATADSLTGTANWNNITLVQDPNSGKVVSIMTDLASIDMREGARYAEEAVEALQANSLPDTKIPIEFGTPIDRSVIYLITDGEGLFEETGGAAGAYQIALNDAYKNARGQLNGQSFSMAGRGTVGNVFSEGGSGAGEGKIEITGTLDPQTKKGTCTISGTANYSGGYGESWKDGENEFRARSDSSYSWTFSGNCEVMGTYKNQPDGTAALETISFAGNVHFERTGTGSSSESVYNKWSQTWTTVGNGVERTDLSDSWDSYIIVVIRVAQSTQP